MLIIRFKKNNLYLVRDEKEDALKLVPFAAFSEHYPDVVKVYTVGNLDDIYSVEICNGPHVENTKALGRFKITKQENVGSGIKRSSNLKSSDLPILAIDYGDRRFGIAVSDSKALIEVQYNSG